MERRDVYRLIDGEREYQDERWGTVEQNPHTIFEWIHILREEFIEMEGALVDAYALDEMRQVAAVAIACLEQHGCSPREGWQPVQQAQLPSEVREALRFAVYSLESNIGPAEPGYAEEARRHIDVLTNVLGGCGFPGEGGYSVGCLNGSSGGHSGSFGPITPSRTASRRRRSTAAA